MKFLLFKKAVYGSFTMSKCKAQAIKTDLGIFRHIHELSRHILAYSEPCVTLACEPWYIRNPDIFSTKSIFRILVYSEHWINQNPRHIQNPVKHLRLAFYESSSRL